jgi:hypothetical protein
MAPLNLNLADDLRRRIEARAAENGFDTVEAYVEAMLLADAAGGPELEDSQLESLLLTRLNGPFVDFDEADFRQMRQKLKLDFCRF